VALTVLPLSGCTTRRATGATAGPPGTATVERAIDGDTIDVRISGRTERVRLLGIDTPETKDPRRPVQCYGKEASAHTEALLPAGTRVRLVRDVESRDKYGRLLAYVYRLPDGLFVNLDLAKGGFAALLTYPPNVAHAGELRAAVDQARARGSGLWGTCGGPGRPASTTG
jgi:micrococcal nuclease